ncbi:YbaB/EbfC family nucleoid-associated protein [Actinokineospora iranica]|uniref:YbaB/EbfC DNA-binding family protein n=1 Tax=Actinokineospora iranica TaxID=1271860 RepID=A0A1G6W7N4_9PSEU|nr:YbaB/EbfC family nucleoid-associated protein [Actinokineospora iranica]SDD61824.1 YbaB/EbfC DNA-binding family protein [Actinokineospora iranica]
MVDPYELLDGIEARVAAMQQQANAVRDEMAAVSVTEHGRGGQITVTVNHMGNLTALEIGQAIRSDPSLAQDIMRTLWAAQSKLGDAMRAGVPSAQATPETMAAIQDEMTRMFPSPPPDDFVRNDTAERFEDLFLPKETMPAPPSPVAPRQPRRPSASPDDDDYYESGDFFR